MPRRTGRQDEDDDRGYTDIRRATGVGHGSPIGWSLGSRSHFNGWSLKRLLPRCKYGAKGSWASGTFAPISLLVGDFLALCSLLPVLTGAKTRFPVHGGSRGKQPDCPSPPPPLWRLALPPADRDGGGDERAQPQPELVWVPLSGHEHDQGQQQGQIAAEHHPAFPRIARSMALRQRCSG
jgi:hypothetical protein